MGGIDMYWHRVPTAMLHWPPRDIWDSVPLRDDADFGDACQDGVVVLVEEDYLLLEVLFAGSANRQVYGPGSLVVSGGEWLAVGGPAQPSDEPEDDDTVGVLVPEQVATAAEFLRTADAVRWTAERAGQLNTVLREYSGQDLDGQRAARLIDSAAELTRFYRWAAEGGEAVVKILVPR